MASKHSAFAFFLVFVASSFLRGHACKISLLFIYEFRRFFFFVGGGGGGVVEPWVSDGRSWRGRWA